MLAPRLPVDENGRLAALRALQILDTPPDEIFDRITRLAARILKTPTALITLVDEDRQWFKSRHGFDLAQTPRSQSFCAYTIADDLPQLLVNDAVQDPRFSGNPLVCGPPLIRFYAGVSLRSVENHRLGALCVIDHVPRQLNEAEISMLGDIGQTAEELLQNREQAIDSSQQLLFLTEREERYRRLIEQMPDAILILSEGRVEFVNSAALHLLGAERQDQLIALPFENLLASEYREGALASAINAADLPGGGVEQAWLRLDGSRVEVDTTHIPFTSGQRSCLQIIARDIGEHKRQRQELERLATHDVLTGLPNRAVLRDCLERGIARWHRQQRKAIVAFVDLDNFKTVNDNLGHGAGDQMLGFVARQLRSCLRSGDSVARIGGDEFALILDDFDQHEKPAQALNRILAAVSQPLWLAGQETAMSCSIGYCRYPDDGTDPDVLLAAADTAMYQAKANGRANAQAYTSEMSFQARERVCLEGELRRALKQNEFVLHYQPKIELSSGLIVGTEALLRWQHPQRGLLSPAHFISAAEESGLIIAIGEWVLRSACRQIVAWKQTQAIDMPVSINLSSRQFLQRNVVSMVDHTLRSLGLDPQLLELELTESMPMGKPEHSISIMQEFRKLGVSLSIDDFGTGYSNLSYLKRFPLDKLKIDQSFIHEITRCPEALAITKAIIAIAHSLHLKVVAEGVETEDQRVLLMLNQCDEMQGYHFSKPLTVDDCTLLLHTHARQRLAHGTDPSAISHHN